MSRTTIDEVKERVYNRARFLRATALTVAGGSFGKRFAVMLRKTEFFKAVDTAGQILQKDFPDKKYSADFIRNLGRKYTLPMEQGDISDLVARAIITAAYQRTEAVEVLVNFETAWEAYQSRMGIRNAA